MPTNLTKLIFYILLTLSPLTWASEPSGTPILRIETEMHTAPIRQISVDAKERFLLTASDDKTLRLWDLETGELITTYRVPIGAGVEGKLNAVAISPDSELVAGGGWTGYEWEQSHSIYLFNRVNGNLVKRLYGLPDTIFRLCFSSNGSYLAASLGGLGIRIWETQHWEQVFSDTQYGDSSYSCQFDAKNRLLTTSDDGYLRLYVASRDNFFLVAQTQPPGGKRPIRAVFSPNGDKIAVGFYDTPQVNVLDGQTLALLDTLETSSVKGDLSEVAWSADGQRLCAGGRYSDKNEKHFLIRCWLQTGQNSYTDWQAATNTISGLLFLNNGDLIYGATDSQWGVLDGVGNKRGGRTATIVDYRENRLLASYDGGTVQFGLERSGGRPARFSLFSQGLEPVQYL